MFRYVCLGIMMAIFSLEDMRPTLATASPTKSHLPKNLIRLRERPLTSAVAVTVSVTQVDNAFQAIPIRFSLAQNYPNPFNSTTIINYSTPATERVRLEIFNGLGRRVATLVNEVQPSGNYSYQWGSEAFSSGVFLYRLTAGPHQQTRRMILLR